MHSMVTEWSPAEWYSWLNIFSQLTEEVLVSDNEEQKGTEEVEEDVNMEDENF